MAVIKVSSAITVIAWVHTIIQMPRLCMYLTGSLWETGLGTDRVIEYKFSNAHGYNHITQIITR